MLRFIVVAFMLSFSSLSYSEDYYWVYDGDSAQYPSITTACNAWVASRPVSPGWTKSYVGYYPSSQTAGQCREIQTYSDDINTSALWWIHRGGTTCSEDATYNPTLGSCELPSCPLGQSRNTLGICSAETCPVINDSVDNIYSPTNQKCELVFNLPLAEFCQYNKGKTSGKHISTVSSNSPDGPKGFTEEFTSCGMTVTSAKCTSKIDPDPFSLAKGSYTCQVSGVFTGEYLPDNTKIPDGYCPTGNCIEPEPLPPEPPVPVPANTHDEKPCVYTTVGSTKECTSSKVKSKEGTAQCGTLNGTWICSTSLPSHNGIEIVTKEEMTIEGTGTKITKTDTANVTTCKNIGDCKTTQTVTTTTKVLNGQGETTSVTGTCIGANCPDKNGNPDGDGDGLGDCVGEDCFGDEGGPPFSGPELDEVDSYQETTEKFYDAVESTPLISGLNEIAAPSGSCWTPTLDTVILGTVVIDGHCQVLSGNLDLIRLLARTLWALAAVFLFFG
jgi:hypothetical protein